MIENHITDKLKIIFNSLTHGMIFVGSEPGMK